MLDADKNVKLLDPEVNLDPAAPEINWIDPIDPVPPPPVEPESAQFIYAHPKVAILAYSCGPAPRWPSIAGPRRLESDTRRFYIGQPCYYIGYRISITGAIEP